MEKQLQIFWYYIMKSKITIVSFLLLFLSLNSCKPQVKEKHVIIQTSYGEIKVKLYNETPLHRDNFVKLIKAGYYNTRIFHRVIKNFMIQGGDENLPENITNSLTKGTYNYTIPAEFNPKLYHKRGALAAARMGDNINPNQESSSTQFYIVQGEKFTPDKLKQIEEYINGSIYQRNLKKFLKEEQDKAYAKDTIIDMVKIQTTATQRAKEVYQKSPFKYNEEQTKTYISEGGSPHLDMNYTVFGEVVSGMDVVDKIAAAQTGDADRPMTDITFSIKLIE
jgi:cyclophilin family peptidyl-prolyl cis-trans isomerase